MKSYCLTDVGVKRNMNQDFVYASDEPVGPLPNLYIVADGMGGHNAGDFASRCAVETMVGYIEHTPQQGAVPVLREAITRANSAILAQSLSDRSMEGMGTTVVAACVIGDSLYKYIHDKTGVEPGLSHHYYEIMRADTSSEATIAKYKQLAIDYHYRCDHIDH